MDLRYPIGPFQWDGDTSSERRNQLIEQIGPTIKPYDEVRWAELSDASARSGF
jgi:hypothetical protein